MKEPFTGMAYEYRRFLEVLCYLGKYAFKWLVARLFNSLLTRTAQHSTYFGYACLARAVLNFRIRLQG